MFFLLWFKLVLEEKKKVIKMKAGANSVCDNRVY